MSEFKFEIISSIGIISERNEWTTELNVVSWNELPAKYDIRSWDKEHKQMSKGISFTEAEVKELKALLNKLEIQSNPLMRCTILEKSMQASAYSIQSLDRDNQKVGEIIIR